MKKIKIIILIVHCMLLTFGCDYEPTVFKYKNTTSELYVYNDSVELYIYSAYIKLDNGLKLKYPSSKDTVLRKRVNIAEYFNVSPDTFMGKTVNIDIRTGITETGNGFDHFYEDVDIVNYDSLYTFVCIGGG